MQWVNRDRDEEADDSSCTFCALPKRGDDRGTNVVARSEHVYVLLNNMPYNPGHLMVIPYDHGGKFHVLDEATVVDCIRTAQTAIAALNDALSPGGYNVGFNVGNAGGASIADHLHMHVIPRWESDTSFLPLTANTAVVEEAVAETYDRVSAALLDRELARPHPERDSVLLAGE
ncbi:HIT family protein [Halomarina pelagica]|uniref:HIT family protein n=1 Tax=Halomarina pelagica TaxID=2961599 RepID=UPI0020C56DD1|nr:HIT domain-containing protein [Halomarina sp. BND7]